MLKESGYPVLAPSKVKAEGGKFRTLEGLPVFFFFFFFCSVLCLVAEGLTG